MPWSEGDWPMADAVIELDPELSRAFAAAAAREDEAPGRVLEAFMRAYLAAREDHARREEARRWGDALTAAAADPTSDEAAVMRWIEEVHDDADWKA